MHRCSLSAGLCALLTGCFGTATLDGSNTPNGTLVDLAAVPRTAAECAVNPVRDPGRPALHRLNRAEYDNTVRDLLGDTRAPSQDFPADDTGYGFDNIASVLSAAPLLVEKYELAAQRLIDTAWDADSPGAAEARLRVCTPESGGGEDACARTALRRFVRKAWRRPPTELELERLLRLLTVAKSQGDGWDVGLKLALKSALLSPHFLYRVELDPVPDAPVAHPLNAHELAARLSYFLWSSMPDDALFAAADSGRLLEDAELGAQVRRMLADPKSQAMVDNFAGQWLHLRAVETLNPDGAAFSEFDSPLRAGLREETDAYFGAFLREDLPFQEFLTARFSYRNERLQQHYGEPTGGLVGEVQRVALTDPNRAGILGHASVLAVTSQPDRTSPTKRGKWVMGQLLCAEPPPPPANVAADLSVSVPAVGTATTRERLAAHRANPTCASCHTMMDAIGLGLENFDLVGRYRTTETGDAAIDASGVLPDGSAFSGATQLAALLGAHPRFTPCVAQKLSTYATGRGDLENQTCDLLDLQRRFEQSGGRLRDLVLFLTQSDFFRKRRGEPVP